MESILQDLRFGARILLRSPGITLLVILALAHPVLNPQSRLAGAGPVALIIDDGWTAARDWTERQTAAVRIPVAMNVHVATSERRDRRLIPHTPWPLVQPPPVVTP